MTVIKSKLINETINYKYSVIAEEFVVESDILGPLRIPVGFMHDFESVPLIKGTSKIGGVVHDYLCRKDSDPIVTKRLAADVYKEFVQYTDSSKWNLVKSWIKWAVVMIAPGYFHKHNVLDDITK
jgi:hypothetical protein